MRWDAKMVLIKVDFPKPVWPVRMSTRNAIQTALHSTVRTNTDYVKLEAPFQKLALDLVCDAVKADVAFWHYRVLQSRHNVGSGHLVLRTMQLSSRGVRPRTVDFVSQGKRLDERSKSWKRG